MVVQDVLSYVRDLYSTPNAGQRFDDAQLISYIDRAQKQIMRTLKWPESTIALQSIAGVQEYQLPEMIAVLRVYVNGQPVVMTSIPVLEGQALQLNPTAQGGGPAGITPPGSPPTVVQTPYAPAWTSGVALTYPDAGGYGLSPSAQPFIVGGMPRYYMRGGNLGVVPIPIGPYPIQVDGIVQPFTLTSVSDAFTLPDIAFDAIAYKAVEQMATSDDGTQGAQTTRDYALGEYRSKLAELRAWKSTLDGVGSTGPQVISNRLFSRGRGQHARSRGYWSED